MLVQSYYEIIYVINIFINYYLYIFVLGIGPQKRLIIKAQIRIIINGELRNFYGDIRL
jgi:hypothetical protein